jgi:hypothetical protein
VKRLEITLDDQTSALLDEFTQEHGGSEGAAVVELLRTHRRAQDLVGEIEAAHDASLREQKERSAKDFRAGRTVSWEEVKR